MKFYQKWVGGVAGDEAESRTFSVTVPGNIQLDYAKANGWGDICYMDNCTRFETIEDFFWVYRCEIQCEQKTGERVFFVTHGIEYEYDVLLNGEKLLHHIGMFTKVEFDITDKLGDKNTLEILIYPHPKREGASAGREWADQSTKPAVEYGWDWHPRCLVSGLWDECYIETRDNFSINDVKLSYALSDDMSSASVVFDIDCAEKCEIELTAPDGKIVYKGTKPKFTLDNVLLWWCNGQGNANLYRWRVGNEHHFVEGRVGFRRVKLVMTPESWKTETDFPKSRACLPVNLELNGRVVFVKGTNWVNPEIFTGTVDEARYRELLTLAAEANMNMLRSWGGAIVNKEAFFDICDELGLMVWQEFPLACNNYKGTDEYLATLEQEAKAVILRVSRHASHCIWCGGNELFNSWSGMSDQSHALRLLNKLCYEYDRDKPFLATAPLMGMAHGYYRFYDVDKKKSVFEMFGNSHYTAYSEFGVPSITEMKFLKEIFDEETLSNPCENSPWELHHAFLAWGRSSWMCLDAIDDIFGKQPNLEGYIEKSTIMQCEGYRFIFEEARRQRPVCAMALNWCYNEPWVVAAGNSLITYPCNPKPSYYVVKKALSPVLPSARFEHFAYNAGEMLRAELFLLNDSTEAVSELIEVYADIDGKSEHIGTWNTGTVAENSNGRGVILQYTLPEVRENCLFTVRLKGKEYENEYKLLLYGKEEIERRFLNF